MQVGNCQLGGRRENSFDLRTEDQPAALLSVEERFLAQPIAAQKQVPSALVPKGDPKHAAQGSQAIGALFFI